MNNDDDQHRPQRRSILQSPLKQSMLQSPVSRILREQRNMINEHRRRSIETRSKSIFRADSLNESNETNNNQNQNQNERSVLKENILIDPVVDASDENVKLSKHFWIDPRSRFKIWWDIVSLICVGHSVIVLPFTLAFLSDYSEPAYATIVGYLIDAFFWFDILVTSFSAFYSSRGTLVVDRTKIIQKYVHSWLIFDVMAVFPFEIFIHDRSARNADLFKVPRLLRITRVLKFLESRYQSLHERARLYSRGFKIFLFLVLSLHWIACAWHALCLDGKDDWCTSEYIHLENNVPLQYASAYQVATSIVLSNDPLQNFSSPTAMVSLKALSFLSIVMLLSGILYIVALGNVAALVTAIVSRDEVQRRKFEQVSDLSEHLNLPKNLQVKMKSYFEYVWLRHRDVDEKRVEHFCKTLPMSLRNDVLLHSHRQMLRAVPIFNGLNTSTILEIVNRMTSIIAMPGDLLISKGRKNSGLFFIARGRVEVLIHNKQAVEKEEKEEKEELQSSNKAAAQQPLFLSAGSYFGEVSLILETEATASVEAVTFCDLFFLSVSDFQAIRDMCPEIKENLIEQRKDLFVASKKHLDFND